MSDDIRRAQDEDYYFDWRIQEFLEGWGRIPVTGNAAVGGADILGAIVAGIDEESLSFSRVEFRESDTGEPWRALDGRDDWRLYRLEETGHMLIRLLEEAQDEGLVMSDAHRTRLARLLNGGVA